VQHRFNILLLAVAAGVDRGKQVAVVVLADSVLLQGFPLLLVLLIQLPLGRVERLALDMHLTPRLILLVMVRYFQALLQRVAVGAVLAHQDRRNTQGVVVVLAVAVVAHLQIMLQARHPLLVKGMQAARA
jgi:hypothetical protein